MTLKELIDSEPANAGKTDQQVLDWLKEAVTVWSDISWLNFIKWRHSEGITNNDLATAAAGTGATATAAQYMLDLVNAGQPLAASDASIRTLIGDSNLPAGKKASLQALAQGSQPRHRQQSEFPGDRDDESWLYHIARVRAA